MRNILKPKKKQFSDFHFSSYGVNGVMGFEIIFTITRKINIGKLIFHSIQHIAHLSSELDQN